MIITEDETYSSWQGAHISLGVAVTRESLQSEGISNGEWRDLWHVLFSE